MKLAASAPKNWPVDVDSDSDLLPNNNNNNNNFIVNDNIFGWLIRITKNLIQQNCVREKKIKTKKALANKTATKSTTISIGFTLAGWSRERSGSAHQLNTYFVGAAAVALYPLVMSQ